MKQIDTVNVYYRQGGFTLLEIMVVVIIIGVMAAVAFPSYRQHLVTNIEKDTQAQMGSLQMELERWRATAMSYRGFYPLQAAQVSSTAGSTKPSFGYSDSKNTKLYVPLSSTAENFRYEIELLDGATFTSLSPAPSQNITLGRSWVMVATPNSNHNTAQFGRTFLQRSDGLKCMGRTPPTDLIRHTGEDCPSGMEKW